LYMKPYICISRCFQWHLTVQNLFTNLW